MKNTFKFILVAFALTTQTTAFADPHEIGNGGDAVVCYDASGKITSVQVLDVYELVNFRKPLNVKLAGVTPEEKAKSALLDMSVYAPYKEKIISAQVDEFFKNGAFVNGINLVDIPDSKHVFIPKGCKVEQIAIQTPPPFPGYPKYTVNKDLWDLLENDNKAALALHEAIYNYAIALGHENSISTRAYNTMVLSGELNSPSTVPNQLAMQAASLGLDVEESPMMNGLICKPVIKNSRGEFYNEAELSKWWWPLGKKATSFPLRCVGNIEFNGKVIPIPVPASAWPNGIGNNREVYLSSGRILKDIDFIFYYSSGNYEFTNNGVLPYIGRITDVNFDIETELYVNILFSKNKMNFAEVKNGYYIWNGIKLEFSSNKNSPFGWIQFHENGQLREFSVNVGNKFDYLGKNCIIPAPMHLTTLRFDESGVWDSVQFNQFCK